MADLSLSVEEDEELLIDPNILDPHGGFSDVCLVGRFLTDRTVHFTSMKHRMASIWRPGRGVVIHDIGSQRYLFQFFHVIDLKRVYEGGPWSFDNCLLLLHHLKPGEMPAQVPLNIVNFWVQVYDLPVGYMSEAVGRQLGDFIGTFLEYDINNNIGCWRAYMRLRVAIDVQKPLKRLKKIRKPGGDWFLVHFKYERLGSFCFLCGCLGHTERFCDFVFTASEGEMKREWGVWLRAPDKRTANLEGSKWLKESGHEGGSNDGGGGATADRATDGWHTSGKLVAGQNLKIIPNPIFSGGLTIVSREENNEKIMCEQNMRESWKGDTESQILRNKSTYEDVNEGYGLELMEDRKRRRAAQKHETQPNHMDLDNVINTSHIAEEDEVQKVSFLLAGPGLQACQEP